MPETVARLLELRQGQPARVHELTLGTHVLGREAGVDVLLRHPDVSRHHAELHITPDGATIRDLGSKNGVLVDGSRVSDATLTHGSRFAFGALSLVLDHAGAHVDRLLVRSGELTVRRPRAATNPSSPADSPAPPLTAPILVALTFTILLGALLVFG
ncbi:ABC transporter ATP-binding/permease protein [Enhygromyxa salina]|uniref:ABC transporter ATP-binding/permease protein n=1 Tax=Enhygromyxa salina TaxID=215803 RepID=A0A2S9YHR2_9BACT|nr:FHA domain-containing protein [Enhygromyxa salina]PRQ04648.1 ABC transporter ATP-binding/permease protein [Enhygromyxa salina]